MTGMDPETNWLMLYREAVFEQDPKQLRVRAAEAQHAIHRRTRELWYAGTRDATERRRMDVAAHFLGILCDLYSDRGSR